MKCITCFLSWQVVENYILPSKGCSPWSVTSRENSELISTPPETSLIEAWPEYFLSHAAERTYS